MPTVNREIFEPTTPTSSLQQSLKDEEQTRPSPAPKSTGAFKNVDQKSGYKDIMRHYEDVVNALFKSFKARYKKNYISKREHESRKDIYRHNLR